MRGLASTRTDERLRALAVLRRAGWATVSFQTLETDFSYWFEGDDAFVGYVDVGSAWVAGGPPVATDQRLREVAERFVAAARSAGRRACFFGCEQRFVDQTGFPALRIGEQPVWEADAWQRTLASPGAASLRYQLQRARRKGVVAREVSSAEVAASGSELHRAVARLGNEWLDGRRMPPMRFLVQLEPLGFAEERVLYVAERNGDVVGFLSAVPVYARRRLFIEDLLRSPDAPNGTVEVLIEAALGSARARGHHAVTLGLAPLAGEVAPALRFARVVAGPLYDFRGLRAFKTRLRPCRWEPVYLCAAPGGSVTVAVRDGLAAFAGGSFTRFGLRTILHRPALAMLAIIAILAVATLLALI